MLHDLILDSLHKLNIHPTTLLWFASFFSGLNFQVVVDGVASKPTNLTSEIIQGSVLSPVCLCIFLHPLLQAVNELTDPDSYSFTDDCKFVTGTSPKEHHQAQPVVNLVNGWSKNHRMPLSLNKSGVSHCGNYNSILQYVLGDHPLPLRSQFKDLSVLRTERATCRDHINIVAAWSSKLCGAILYSFRTR